jgi:uncharacterized protein (TIGR03083 family)
VNALDAFAAEAAALTYSLGALTETSWIRPTRCPPWDVRDLFAHVYVVTARVPEMLAAPAPARAQVSAVEYYRPDERFGPATTTDRISTAQNHAARQPGAVALAAFRDLWQSVLQLCQHQPADRVVRTRHGDAMLLSEFLATRVVEVAVHGLDLADALDQQSWLTPAAAAVLQELLLGPECTVPNPEHFIRAATGRGSDPDLLTRLRPRRLTLA